MAKRGNNEGSIRKRTDGSWEGRYTDPFGKRKSVYGKTRVEVKEKITRMIAGIDSGTYLEPNRITLNQWMERWLWEYKRNDLKERGFQSYHKVWSLYIKGHLGEIRLWDLRSDHVQTEVNRWKVTLSPATIHLIISVLGACLREAQAVGILAAVPLLGIKLPRTEKKPIKALTREEQSILVEALEEEAHDAVYIFALNTGMRIGEILALQWPSVDFKAQTVTIEANIQVIQEFDENRNYSGRTYHRSKSTKSGKSRIMPLSADATAILKKQATTFKKNKMKVGSLYNDQGYVFADAIGRPLVTSTVQQRLYRITKKNGLPKISPHDLRHTFATRCLENGISPKVVQTWLGHATVAMTLDMYSHVLPDQSRVEMDKLEGAFR